METKIEESIKKGILDLYTSLEKLEVLNSDLLVIVTEKATEDERNIMIWLKSKSDLSCIYLLDAIFFNGFDSFWVLQSVRRAQLMTDFLVRMLSYYSVRRTVLGELVKR